MAHDEMTNLMTVFTNQSNKIWNLATYTAPHQLFQKGSRGDAFATFAGLMLMGIMTNALSKGAPPDDPEELLQWMSSEPIGSTPLVGKSIVSAMNGYSSGGTVFDTLGKDVFDVAKSVFNMDLFTAKNADAIFELCALTCGVPYSPLRRAIKAAREGNPAELMGWGKKVKKTKLPQGMSYYSQH